jgi:hypothetical protein
MTPRLGEGRRVRHLFVLGLVVISLHACPSPPDPLTADDGGVRDAGGAADAGSVFVGRPERPCEDIEGWRTVSLAPNGTLTAANVSDVLSAVGRPGSPLNNIVADIARADRTRCTTGATTSCTCPDGGTVVYTVTRTTVADVTTLLQCTVATSCGYDGRLVDGASAQREVTRLVQGQERKQVTEAYRYSWVGSVDHGIYVELSGTQVTLPLRYGIPVADGVVSVLYDRNTPNASVSVIDAQGQWSCGAYAPTGTCTRGAMSLPFMLR